METEYKKKSFIPKWVYILAIVLLGMWAISVLFFAIGTLVHIIFLFLILFVVIYFARGRRNRSNTQNP